jgi:hypothetical protein
MPWGNLPRSRRRPARLRRTSSPGC